MSEPKRAARSAPGELALSAFGPLADALGQELARLPPFAARNLTRLIEAFQRKRPDGIHEREISARLFKQVIDEAAWSEDEIVAEYLGGVLASSGSSVANDRGVAIVALVRRLSALQLRAHYLFYSELLRLEAGHGPTDLRWSASRMIFHLELDMEEFMSALGLADIGNEERNDITAHIVLGLSREALIDEDSWDYVIDPLQDGSQQRPPHVAVHPSPLGAELFLWGSGSAVIDQSQLLDPGLEIVLLDDMPRLRHSRIGNEDEEYELQLRVADELLSEVSLDALRRSANQLISDRPNAAPGYFYLSLIRALEQDVPQSRALMERTASFATYDQRKIGLRTIDSMMIQHPSKFEDLLALARILEKATGSIA